MSLDQKLGTTGVWFFTDLLDHGRSRELAARIESLGYAALWIPDTVGRDPFVNAALLLESTTDLVVATGIANIHMRHPGMMKQELHRSPNSREAASCSGWASHAPLVTGLRKLDYSKPLTTMRTYLDDMDTSLYMAVPPAEEVPVVLAALGPKMLELAAERTKGAHPYWTTPEHTAMAREIMGPDAWLCVEQSVFSLPTPTSPTPPPTISSACTPTFRTTATTGSGSVSPMTKSATARSFLDA